MNLGLPVLRCIVPYFIILFCLTRNDFTHQGESTGIQPVHMSHVDLVNWLTTSRA